MDKDQTLFLLQVAVVAGKILLSDEEAFMAEQERDENGRFSGPGGGGAPSKGYAERATEDAQINSNIANSTRKIEDHEKAAEAHEKAADVRRRAGDAVGAEKHQREATRHKEQVNDKKDREYGEHKERADKATQTALKHGDPRLHKDAAAAHDKAAEKAKSDYERNLHRQQAESHRQRSGPVDGDGDGKTGETPKERVKREKQADQKFIEDLKDRVRKDNPNFEKPKDTLTSNPLWKRLGGK